MATLYGKQAKEVLTSNAPDYEDIDEGAQGKYNHTDCSMGEDTKTRLYVKNLDGAYMWHCHNCSESGYYRPRETVQSIREDADTSCVGAYKSTGAVTYKAMGVRKYSEFDMRGKLWLSRYGFDESMITQYGIKEMLHGVLMPTYLSLDVVTGYQMRRYDVTPKYHTDTTHTFSWLHHPLSPKLVILTEDLLSSYKLHQAGYSTVCLLGTKITEDASHTILSSEYNRVVLWLDDDPAGHAAALKYSRELSPLFALGVTSINIQQPKEIPMSSLLEMDV